MSDETIYSETVEGDERNYAQPVRFDATDGYIGITQHDHADTAMDRVLLSPDQVRALLAFLAANGYPAGSPR